MKRALLFLAVAALWSATSLVAATINITKKDPRSDPDLIDRDWGARLRNFRTPVSGNEIYIGSGDLSFSGNRNVADMVWNNPPGTNTFTLTYVPSPARLTITATGSTSATQFYDFQTPVANPNQPFNNILIQLKSPQGSPEITITNLVLSVSGGATTNPGDH